MNIDEKRRWLGSYLQLRREADDIMERVMRLRSEAERMSARLTGMPGGGPSDDRLQRCAAELADLADEYARKATSAVRRARGIEKAIGRVSSPMYRTVLRRKYIDGRSYLQIADEIGYTERNVQYIELAAVRAL